MVVAVTAHCRRRDRHSPRTKSEHIDHWTKMHHSRGQFSGSETSRHMHFSGACIANMFEFEFSVYTGSAKRGSAGGLVMTSRLCASRSMAAMTCLRTTFRSSAIFASRAVRTTALTRRLSTDSPSIFGRPRSRMMAADDLSAWRQQKENSSKRSTGRAAK